VVITKQFLEKFPLAQRLLVSTLHLTWKLARKLPNSRWLSAEWNTSGSKEIKMKGAYEKRGYFKYRECSLRIEATVRFHDWQRPEMRLSVRKVSIEYS